MSEPRWIDCRNAINIDLFIGAKIPIYEDDGRISNTDYVEILALDEINGKALIVERSHDAISQG